MSKQQDNRLVPRLRFPEFQNKSSWVSTRLSDFLFEHKEKSTGNEEVYSVSVHKGVVNQIEHLGRTFAASNTENYKRVFPGDIIYTKSPTGDFPLGIIKQSKVTKAVIVSPLYAVFKPETYDLGVIIDAYFEYPERTINYLSSIIQKGAKNTINIKNETFLSKSLIIPTDKAEQQKIADCLSSLDDLITAESQKLDELREYKKGLLQNLFPQEGETVPRLRFREFEDSGDWVEKELGSFCANLTAGRDKNVADGQYVLYGSTGIIGRTVNASFEGDFILVARVGANAGLLNKVKGKFGVTDNTLVIDLVKKDLINFIFYSLESAGLNKLVFGSGQPLITGRQLKSLLITMSRSKKEQNKISDLLILIDELIDSQNQKVESLNLHKKGLLQGLFPDINEMTK